MLPATSSTDNTRGILFMLASCVGFIVNDTCVKLASTDMTIPQVIVLRSLIALPLVLVYCWHQGLLGNLRTFRNRVLWWRTLGEVGGTAAYLTALARLDIAAATAIAQTTPLAVTAGAAVFLGEKVGVRRWSAILVGFCAVMLIIRPGMEGFNAWGLMVLLSVSFVALRDLTSRMLPDDIHPLTVTVVSLAALVGLGLAMSPFEPWTPITTRSLLYCLVAAVTLSLAYAFVVLAVRYGEMSSIAPFRYSFLLWAILVQIVVFSVWPDGPTLIGSAILIGTGLYTVFRERKVRGAAASLTSKPATVPPPS